MGVNNKARRAAKRRRQRTGATRSGFTGERATASSYDDEPIREREDCELSQRLTRAIRVAVQEAHWTPGDLAEITRRRLSARHVPLVAGLVAAETDRHEASTTTQEWRDELREMGPRQPLDLGDTDGWLFAVDMIALIYTLPVLAEVIPPPGTARRLGDGKGSGGPSAVLAKVRALLAKAESTDFPHEAEALSAKAQELIATYALDRYAVQMDEGTPDPAAVVRRLWIDAPYVDAKALLVDAVAGANHCRAVFAAALGCVNLVGHPADLEATELLVTSLQVQADRAMLHHGRMTDGRGESRTRSFRRSFLVSYAARIRERLRHASDEALAASSRSSELVPVLARNDERVRRLTAELFPNITMRSTSISNREGWAAGRAAADLAQLDTRERVTDRTAC
ncbi:MAG TPA: DUF2786 domain-containing protein [Mycobacteriales bacterium]|nr:DUF2786 domain-containing protein [Mycobacteriales bacterium]